MAVIDDAKFRWQMQRLFAALPREVADVALRYEAAAFTRKVVSFLPPKTKQQGELAIRRDIARAIRVLDPAKFDNPRLRKALSQATAAEANEILKNIPAFKGLSVQRMSPALHTSRRNRRGRVPRGTTPALVIGREDVRRYSARVEARAGYLKSGYVPAARALGAALPGWITRHGDAGQGAFLARIGSPGSLHSVTITNRAGRYFDHARMARDALRSRGNALETKVRRLIAGKAVNLGFKGQAGAP
jgi:hypothetical protein